MQLLPLGCLLLLPTILALQLHAGQQLNEENFDANTHNGLWYDLTLPSAAGTSSTQLTLT